VRISFEDVRQGLGAYLLPIQARLQFPARGWRLWGGGRGLRRRPLSWGGWRRRRLLVLGRLRRERAVIGRMSIVGGRPWLVV